MAAPINLTSAAVFKSDLLSDNRNSLFVIFITSGTLILALDMLSYLISIRILVSNRASLGNSPAEDAEQLARKTQIPKRKIEFPESLRTAHDSQ